MPTSRLATERLDDPSGIRNRSEYFGRILERLQKRQTAVVVSYSSPSFSNGAYCEREGLQRSSQWQDQHPFFEKNII